MQVLIRCLFVVSSSLFALALGFVIGHELGAPPASTDADVVIELQTGDTNPTKVAATDVRLY